MEFIHFTLNHQNYLLNSQNIKEIITYPKVRPLVETSKYIDGIFTHKGKIIPVLSLRSILNITPYKTEQINILKKVEEQHETWVEDFTHTLNTDVTFTKALDPHKCELGKWIDSMIKCTRCNQNGFIDIIKKEVIKPHSELHETGKVFLKENDPAKHDYYVKTIKDLANETIKGLHNLQKQIQKLTYSFERIVIYDINGTEVGLVVDSVEQLYDIEEKNFFNPIDPLSDSNRYIQFIDHYEINKKHMYTMRFTNEIETILKDWQTKADTPTALEVA